MSSVGMGILLSANVASEQDEQPLYIHVKEGPKECSFDNVLDIKHWPVSYPEKKTFIFILPIIIAIIVISLLKFENIYSIFPIIASVLILTGFLLNDENKIRFIGIVCNMSWLVYGIIYLSYPSIFFEILTTITTAMAIVRNKKNKESKE